MSCRTGGMDLLSEMRRNIAAESSLFGPRLASLPISAETAWSRALTLACPGSPALRDFSLALEYIFEGYLLHYGSSRLLHAQDEQFRLLAGDYMYARGLSYVSRQEDLFAIQVLADLIALCSHLHAGEAVDAALPLAVWDFTTLCLALRLAAGDEVCQSHREAFAEFAARAWQGGAQTGELTGLCETLLGDFDGERRTALAGCLEAIHAGINHAS